MSSLSSIPTAMTHSHSHCHVLHALLLLKLASAVISHLYLLLLRHFHAHFHFLSLILPLISPLLRSYCSRFPFIASVFAPESPSSSPRWLYAQTVREKKGNQYGQEAICYYYCCPVLTYSPVVGKKVASATCGRFVTITDD